MDRAYFEGMQNKYIIGWDSPASVDILIPYGGQPKVTINVTLSVIFHEVVEGEPTHGKQPWELYKNGIKIICILKVWTEIAPCHDYNNIICASMLIDNIIATLQKLISSYPSISDLESKSFKQSITYSKSCKRFSE
ncbi:hypothetical protein BB560_007330, partial [Smittium megazygosporum]